jgi:hypothetical protein
MDACMGCAPNGRVGDPAGVLVLVVLVVVERDAVLLSERGVLVLFFGGVVAIAAESQIERTGTGLLQLARFFEAAVTTLLHDGLRNLES